jgi:hypothetical protein
MAGIEWQVIELFRITDRKRFRLALKLDSWLDPAQCAGKFAPAVTRREN